METFKTEGIVLSAIPFRNYDCILTLFTPSDGLIGFFYRGAYRSKKKSEVGAITPLSVVEILYTKGRGELYSCGEISVINHNLALRHHLNTLEAACEMLKAVTATQQPGKPASELYRLFSIYLNKLPFVLFPQVLTGSFRLKLLRSEGVLPLLSHCCICAAALNETWIHENEAFCSSHTPSRTLSFLAEERRLIEHLAFCRDFTQFIDLNIPLLLSKKIHKLFDELLAP